MADYLQDDMENVIKKLNKIVDFLERIERKTTKEILNIYEVSDLLNINVETIRKYVKSGDLKNYKPKGKNTYYLMSDIIEFIKK